MAVVHWNQTIIQAVRKLAEASTRYRANGVPLYRKDWELGIKKLQTQDPEAYKIVKNIPIPKIKWFWSKFQNVAYGFCATTSCKNKVETGFFYCRKCKPNQGRTGKGLFTKQIISENIDLVKVVLNRKTKDELSQGLISSMRSLPYAAKRQLLGPDFEELVTAKEEDESKKKATRRKK